MVGRLFEILLFGLPFVFFPKTSEVFEFNKIVAVYVFTVLIAAAWAIKCVRAKKIIFRRTAMDVPILIFLGSQVLATMFSIDIRTSLFGYYSRFNGGLLSLISYSLLYWTFVSNVRPGEARRIMRGVLYAAVVVATWAVFEHYGYSLSCVLLRGELNATCWKQDVTERAFATFGQPNWLAAYLVATAPIGWLFLSKAKRKAHEYYVWLGASFLIIAALLFTKSRSGLIGFGIAMVIFWIRKADRKMIDLVMVIVLAVGVVSLGARTVADTEGMLITPSSDIRLLVWRGAIEVWKEYPLVGSGVETFGYSYFLERTAEHNVTSEWNLIYNKAHNEYLNYLATTGIVGFGAYLLLIGSGIRVLVQSGRMEILAGYMSILATSFFGFNVVMTSLLFFLMPAIAIVCRKR